MYNLLHNILDNLSLIKIVYCTVMYLEPTAMSPFSRQTEHHTDCAGNVIVWVQLPSEILSERMSLLNALLAANSHLV